MYPNDDFEIEGDTLVKYTGSSPTVIVPDGVTVIGEGAFSGNESLKRVIIPESVRIIGDFAFAACFGLENIAFPAGMTTIGNFAFDGCASLINITIPASVEAVGSYVFDGCTGLKKITFLGNTSIDSTVFPDSQDILIEAPASWKEKYPFIETVVTPSQPSNPRHKTKIYGIDLGGTYSVIATLNDNGLPTVIENQPDASPLLASAVYFPEGGDPVVGEYAKMMKESEPDRVVEFVKRYMGRSDTPTYEFDGVQYDPVTISALILKRIKTYADEQGHDVQDVVITCPAYFGNDERTATKQAGELAGLNVLNIVNEPTAAALNYCYYCYGKVKGNRKILVYDLGGATFDITLLDFIADDDDGSMPSLDIIDIGGDERLGGVDWDGRLYDLMCRKYAEENCVEIYDMDDVLKILIKARVEEVKKALSQLQNRSVIISYDGDRTQISVSRQEFEECTSDLVEHTTALVQKLLGDNNLTPEDVDVVLLVGGSTRMPMIQKAVKNLFSEDKVRVEEPDLAVAKGAAIAAAIV